jgi:hypothetical protein
MTIREFWHDLRDRFGDDQRDPRDWQNRSDERYANRWHDREPRESMRLDPRQARGDWERRDVPRGGSSYSSLSTQRFLSGNSGRTAASYDPGLYKGNTWSADERSSNWTQRNIDDYAEPAAGYTDIGWPDRYSSSLYGVSYRGVGPQNWQRDDARIREDICELMTEDDELDASGIEVTVQGAEVTLSGSVASRSDKRRAEDLAEQVSGVRDVHNRLQVSQSSQTLLSTRGTSPGSPISGSFR